VTAPASIWQAAGAPTPEPLSGTAWRLVESQEHIATLGYVDSLAEQALLETLLDSVKPPMPANSDAYHYLLKTPFRYPPLRHGSRFGRVHEPGIFYAGCDWATTLAEVAYYRGVFWHSLSAKRPAHSLRTQHSLFSVDYQTSRGLRLHQPPFLAHRAQLCDGRDYRATQTLGSDMRAAGVTAFEYTSARDLNQGLCVGLFNLSPLVQKTPKTLSAWSCEVTATHVTFKAVHQPRLYHFAHSQFEINGEFPLPSA
jgi:hypothetical protein